MLQQTQVATVIGYFERFLAAFPTIADLAAADEQRVLRLWEGLGYYRRARQLHAAARRIMANHQGQFPREIDPIRALPGIGRYTAGAIASIAWDAREPILEANTVRLFSRLLNCRDDPNSAGGRQRLWAFAAQILPRKSVGQFNQALMELGSQICTPRQPACDRCPLQPLCPTFAGNLQDQIPPRARRTVYEDRREAAIVIRRDDGVVLRRRQPGERWAGLWELPRFSVAADETNVDETDDAPADLEQAVLAQTGLNVRIGPLLATLKHGVTRFRITLICHEASWIAGCLPTDGDVRWVKIAELDGYPLSATGRRICRLLA